VFKPSEIAEGGNPNERRGHRDIDIRENRESREQKIGNFHGKSPGKDLSHPYIGGYVARSGESINISGILWTGSPYISELRSPKPRKEGSAICGASYQCSGESALGISEFLRSRKLGHFKS
jgi:hypothetical protein